MKNPKSNQHIVTAGEAVRALLCTMFGDDAPLRLGKLQAADGKAVAEDAKSLLGIVSEGEGFAVLLDSNWLPLIAGLKLGVSTRVGDEEYEAVVEELVAHFHDGICAHFASQGIDLAPAKFFIKEPGAQLPRGLLASIEGKLPFFMEWDGVMFHGFVLTAAELTHGKDVGPVAAPTVRVQPASFPDLGAESVGESGLGGLGLLGDVELEVTVELGRRRMPLSDILRLTSGSVLELEKLVGEPLQVFANNRLIAEGEAVVIDDQFGVRITALASRSVERAPR